MRPSSVALFEQLISKPRLNSYRGYFQASQDEATGLYMWNCEVSANFGTLLAMFEIALRNNAHRAMSQFYSRGTSDTMHWYDRMRLKSGPQKKLDVLRFQRGPGGVSIARTPAPGPDEIVSRVSFGFWPGALGSMDARYASQICPLIFPAHPLNANPSDWQIESVRRQALAFLHEINTFRNRLAHHEPLWKFAALLDTSSPGAPTVIAPESLNLAGSLSRFHRLLSLLDTAIASLNPSFQADLLQASWRKKLSYLLSDRGVQRYRALKHCAHPRPLTPAQFRKEFGLVMKNNQAIQVRRAGIVGLFTPHI